MKIRSICVGIDASWPLDTAAIQRAGALLARAATVFGEAGVEVQTTRLALSPFAEAGPADDAAWVVPFARTLEAACREHGIFFTSIGPIRWGRLGPEAGRHYAEALADAIIATEQINGSIEATNAGRPSGGAALAAGRLIARVAHATPDGFGNFRFCTTAECGPNFPFFPAGYHGGGPARFTIGLQAADDVRQAFAGDGSLDDLEVRLGETLGAQVQKVEALARTLEADAGIAFGGTDLTPAPFTTPEFSSAGMLEDLGVSEMGAPGTLAAASALTRMVKRLPYDQVGYSGLMLPVLEDSLLAARASAGLVSVSELLLYSAVCGTGLDTVPVPGDAAPEQLAAVVLDVSALALALRKPLSCRLFPVPGKAAGEQTEYDSPYLCNGAVLPLKGRVSPRLFERFAP